MKRVGKINASISDWVLYIETITKIMDWDKLIHTDKEFEKLYGDDALLAGTSYWLVDGNTNQILKYSSTEEYEEEMSEIDIKKYSKPRFKLELVQKARWVTIWVTDEWSEACSWEQPYAEISQRDAKVLLAKVENDLSKLEGSLFFTYYGPKAKVFVK